METLANRNNNPGNIKDTSTGKFKIYSSPQEGFAALMNDLEIKKSGRSQTGLKPEHTLVDFAKTYAPASDKNDPAQYAANIANIMGTRPDAQLKDLDVGSWAEAVAQSEGYKGSSSAQSQQGKQPQQEQSQIQQEKPKKDFMQKTTDVVSSIFPGGKVGEAIGTLGGYGYTALGEKMGFMPKGSTSQYDLSAPTPLQVAGDVAQGALMVGTGIPGAGATSTLGKTALGAYKGLNTAKTVAGRIGQGVGIGTGFGATSAIKEGSTDLGEIGKQAAFGGITGGVFSGAGEVISKIAQKLPERIVNSFLKGKGMGEEQLKYAMDKGLGSPSKMFAESEASISSMGKQLGDTLKNPNYKDFKVPGRDILNKIIQDFPDAGLTRVDIIKKIQSIVPLKTSLVKKLLTGNLTLDELHVLNSALGKNTFKTVFDGVEVKANKEIGSALYHSIGDIIKNVAPETEPLFANLSKEYPLNSALQGLISRGEKSKMFTLRDLVALLSGFSVGGVPGAIAAYGLDKVASSPTVNLKTAGLLNQLTKPGAQAFSKGIKGPVLGGIINAENKPLSKEELKNKSTGLFSGNVKVR